MLTADAKQCSKRRLSLDSGHGTSVADEDTQSHLDTSFSSRLVESGHHLFLLFGNHTWNYINKRETFNELILSNEELRILFSPILFTNISWKRKQILYCPKKALFLGFEHLKKSYKYWWKKWSKQDSQIRSYFIIWWAFGNYITKVKRTSSNA